MLSGEIDRLATFSCFCYWTEKEGNQSSKLRMTEKKCKEIENLDIMHDHLTTYIKVKMTDIKKNFT